MAVALTGSAVTNTTYGDGSQAITIPADAEAVIVAVPGVYVNNTAVTFDKLNFDDTASAVDFTSIVTNADTTNPYDVFAYIMTSTDADWPGTGSATVYWAFNSAPGEGGVVEIWFVKGLDESDPTRSTDSNKATGASTWTATLASVDADDLTFIIGSDYQGGGHTITVTNDSQTELDSGSNDNSVIWAIGYEQGEGSPSVTYNVGTYSGEVAFALKVASTGGGSSIAPIAAYYNMVRGA
jgi:hypothetical protein